MANINDAQLQQIIQGLRDELRVGGGNNGRLQVSNFETAEPEDWVTWRRNFEVAARINAWNDERQRLELTGHMTGRAARLIRHIPFEGNGQTIAQVLAAYEEQFIPEAESDMARAAFAGASQRADETTVAWAARCQSLYTRGFPAGGADDRALIDKYVAGLRERDIAGYAHQQNPQTFLAAKQAAGRQAANRQFLASAWTGKNSGGRGGVAALSATESPEINAFGPRGGGRGRYRGRGRGMSAPPRGRGAAAGGGGGRGTNSNPAERRPGAAASNRPDGRKCYGCDGIGHILSDCPNPVKQQRSNNSMMPPEDQSYAEEGAYYEDYEEPEALN